MPVIRVTVVYQLKDIIRMKLSFRPVVLNLQESADHCGNNWNCRGPRVIRPAHKKYNYICNQQIQALFEVIFVEKVCGLLRLLLCLLWPPFSVLSDGPWGSLSRSSALPQATREGKGWTAHSHSRYFIARYSCVQFISDLSGGPQGNVCLERHWK